MRAELISQHFCSLFRYTRICEISNFSSKWIKNSTKA